MQVLNDTSEPQVIVTRAVEIAEARFARAGAAYRAEVSGRDGTLVVSFIDRTAPLPAQRRTRGNPGLIPGFEVVLDRATMTILRSHFIR